MNQTEPLTQAASTQVAIIGAGPSGLMLGQLLHLAGIETVIIERQTREHVRGRIRAGVLEWGSVETIREAGIGGRMDREGLVHDGFEIAFDGEPLRIDLGALAGKSVMVYGQTEVTKDLIDAREALDLPIVWQAQDVALHEIDRGEPHVTYADASGAHHRVNCAAIAACDGYHGVGRKSLPAAVLREYERIYPFGWLGLLADVPPCHDELIYANHARGFALCSMRSETRSRYYVQVDSDDRVENWSDDRFFDELRARIGPYGERVTAGPALEKSIAPLRSFVAEPLRHGDLYLAGDSMHIVPPTGAKGLNMALADVRILAEALADLLSGGKATGVDSYSARALKRVWQVERFSWMMSELLHQFPHYSPFERRMQRSAFDELVRSETARKVIAENYVGLPI